MNRDQEIPASKDNHECENSAGTADDLNQATADEHGAAEKESLSEAVAAESLAAAAVTDDPSEVLADMPRSPEGRPIWRHKPTTKLFGFDRTCDNMLGLAYILAWLFFILAAIIELFAIVAAVLNLRRTDSETILLLLGGLFGIFNSFVWIVVLARIMHVRAPSCSRNR
jgi:hypothetical protein